MGVVPAFAACDFQYLKYESELTVLGSTRERNTFKTGNLIIL